MKVLKATETQYNALDGYRNGNFVLKFAKDANDNWIVGKSVLTDPNFAAIHDQLNELEKIEFVKPQNEVEI